MLDRIEFTNIDLRRLQQSCTSGTSLSDEKLVD